MNRRTFLTTAALSSAIVTPGARETSIESLAGPFRSSLDRRTETDRPAANRRDGASATTAVAVTEYTTSSSTPEWWTEGDEAGGTVDCFETETAVRDELDLDAVDPDRRDKVDEFITTTAFDESVLLYIASVGPSTASETIDVTATDESEPEPMATAQVVDTRGDGVRAGATLTFPSVLTRVPLEMEQGDGVSVRIVDGWGEEHVVQAVGSGC